MKLCLSAGHFSEMRLFETLGRVTIYYLNHSTPNADTNPVSLYRFSVVMREVKKERSCNTVYYRYMIIITRTLEKSSNEVPSLHYKWFALHVVHKLYNQQLWLALHYIKANGQLQLYTYRTQVDTITLAVHNSRSGIWPIQNNGNQGPSPYTISGPAEPNLIPCTLVSETSTRVWGLPQLPSGKIENSRNNRS